MILGDVLPDVMLASYDHDEHPGSILTEVIDL